MSDNVTSTFPIHICGSQNRTDSNVGAPGGIPLELSYIRFAELMSPVVLPSSGIDDMSMAILSEISSSTISGADTRLSKAMEYINQAKEPFAAPLPEFILRG